MLLLCFVIVIGIGIGSFVAIITAIVTAAAAAATVLVLNSRILLQKNDDDGEYHHSMLYVCMRVCVYAYGLLFAVFEKKIDHSVKVVQVT